MPMLRIIYRGVSEKDFHSGIITDFYAPNEIEKQSFENQQTAC